MSGHCMRAAAAVAILSAVSVAARAGDETAPKSLELWPNFETIGVYAHFSGDSNRNSTVKMHFRKAGDEEWTEGHPLDRNAPGRWAGAIFWLTPDTEYEVRVAFSDPDGAEPAELTTKVRTRNDRWPVGKGDTWHVSPKGDDAAAGTEDAPFATIQKGVDSAAPGDTVLTLKSVTVVKGKPATRPGPQPLNEKWQIAAAQIMVYCAAMLWEPEGEDARRWLNERGLADETLKDHYIGFNKTGRKLYGLWVPRGITIPHWQESLNRIWGIKIRLSTNGPDKYRAVKGSVPCLYLADNLRGSMTWLVSRSAGMKIRLAVVGFLVLWLCGITFPATVISSVPLEKDDLMAVFQSPTPTEVPIIEEAPREPVETPAPEPPTPTPTEEAAPLPGDAGGAEGAVILAVVPTETPTPEPPTPTATSVPPTATTAAPTARPP